MKTVIFQNDTAWPERTNAVFFVQECIEKEYQFEVTTNEGRLQVGFWKGSYTIRIDQGEILEFTDSGLVQGEKTFESGVLAGICDAVGASSEEKVWRKTAAEVIQKYLHLRKPEFFKDLTIQVNIHLPGRNGIVTETGIEVVRKDW